MRSTRDVLATGSSHGGRPKLPREQVLARVMACIERSECCPVELEDFYVAAGVSPRTLRTMFMDVFGITPSRYLRLRRLHQLRTALLMADPMLRTVNGICTHFRLSDAGRVAQDYRALFGEYPHQTLARRPARD